MSTVSDPAESASAIQQQMRQVRRELGEDVQEIVDNARTMTDWKHYVRTYPWACVGVALAAGYFVVPSRPHLIRPDAQTLAQWAKDQKIVVEPQSQARPKSTLTGQLMGMAASALLQGGLAVLRQYMSGQLAVPPRAAEYSPPRAPR
jgi:hypothetical protein